MLTFYVTEEEKAFILKKMEAYKIPNMSAYLRKAAIDGKIEIYDFHEIKDMNYNFRKIGVNINQIAKRVNETSAIFSSDIEDLQHKMNEIMKTQKTILSMILSAVKKEK